MRTEIIFRAQAFKVNLLSEQRFDNASQSPLLLRTQRCQQCLCRMVE
jgi:hypothetical protein